MIVLVNTHSPDQINTSLLTTLCLRVTWLVSRITGQVPATGRKRLRTSGRQPVVGRQTGSNRSSHDLAGHKIKLWRRLRSTLTIPGILERWP
jgi:hypothetical protein